MRQSSRSLLASGPGSVGRLRRGDHLGLEARGPEAAGQGEAGGPGLVDDLGDLRRGTGSSRSTSRSGSAGWTQVATRPRRSLSDGDVVGGLVDVDADVERPRRRRGGAWRSVGRTMRVVLGRGHGRDLREGDERVTCSSLPSERLRPSCYRV